MKYGHFDDERREYVITNPKTPFPWINYLGTERFFSLISHTAGGYSFYKDARKRRISRYRYNDVPRDMGSRAFYIHDQGDVWSPAWKPVKAELESWACRHGLGYTRVEGSRGGIESEVTFTVPRGKDVEYQRLRVRNTSGQRRPVSVYVYLEFALWDSLDDMTNFQRNLNTGEVVIEEAAVYHITEYRERRNHYAWYASSRTPDGIDTDRTTFLGVENGLDRPDQVYAGTSGASVASGWAPVAAFRFDLDLAPGQTEEILLTLGYAENDPEAKWTPAGTPNLEVAHREIAAANMDSALEELAGYWDDVLTAMSVSSGDDKLDRMVNTWNPYQCTVTYHMARSASYFESGVGRGIGFRDTNQDLLGSVHQLPEACRSRILDVASIQMTDGSAYHQYQPLTKKGNDAIGGNFRDDPLWLLYSTTAYVKETGDYGILDEKVAFDGQEPDATLYDHLIRSLDHLENNLGPHSLPLIGRADWNDCLNLNAFSDDPDESFQTCGTGEGRVAESVMIAGIFLFVAQDFRELSLRHGQEQDAQRIGRAADVMEKAVVAHGWDGNWYLRAYDAEGTPVGSVSNEEGKIFIESQGFCAMARVGEDQGYPELALDAVVEHLDSEYGIVLVQPPYSRYDKRLGEISSYPPGYKENAGIFCHNNPWIIIAEALAGRGEAAFEHYRKIAPAYLEDQSDIHVTEPYVYAQMIAGKDAVHHGQAKNSWLTGTAAWNFVAITQYILGVRPGYDGLIVDPVIPGSWKGYTVTRRYRGAVYTITVENPRGVESGVARCVCNGEEVDHRQLPVAPAGAEVSVTVTLG